MLLEQFGLQHKELCLTVVNVQQIFTAGMGVARVEAEEKDNNDGNVDSDIVMADGRPQDGNQQEMQLPP